MAHVLVVLVSGLFGLLILIPLWPGQREGRRLLRRWGITEPTEGDIADAQRYLRRRRFWYPWLFMLFSGAATAWIGRQEGDDTLAMALATVLVGSLVAELLAQRPTRAAQREAMLAPRGVRDLVPVWALVVFGLAVVAGAVRLGLLRQWLLFAIVLVAAVLTGLMLLLAVRRPAVGRPEVDLALRTRSARVAVGLGAAVATWLAAVTSTLPSLVLGVLGIVALLAIANPVPVRLGVRAR